MGSDLYQVRWVLRQRVHLQRNSERLRQYLAERQIIPFRQESGILEKTNCLSCHEVVE